MALDDLIRIVASARPLPLALLVVSVLAGLVARAARWGVYFRPARSVPFGPLLGTLSISYMASTFLPFRVGELVRAAFLSRREDIAVSRIVGTILLEKLFDFLALGVMLVALLLTTPLPVMATVVGSSLTGVIVVGFGLVLGLALWRQPTLRLLGVIEKRLPFGIGTRVGLARAAEQFAGGTDSLKEITLWGPMLVWTAVAWGLAGITVWSGGLAVGVPLSLAAVTFMAVVTSAGQAVPSSPGYVGVYHFWAVLALTTFGLDATVAAGIGVLTHAFTYGTLVVVGIVALWLGGYSLRDLLFLRPAPRALGADE